MSSLTLRNAPSQPGVGHVGGSWTTVVRGRCSGNLRRGFLVFAGASLFVAVSVVVRCDGCRGLRLGFGFSFGGLDLFELQLELRYLALDAFR